MAQAPAFKYAPMFQRGKDDTEYYLLTKEGVSTGEFEGKTIVKVTPEALTLLANTAFRDVNFHLRRKHNEMLRKRAKTTSSSLSRSSETPKWLPRVSFPTARTPVRPSFTVKRGSRCGRASAMKKRSRSVSTRPTRKKTSAIPRTLRFRCTKK